MAKLKTCANSSPLVKSLIEMVKYKQYYKDMVAQNETTFSSFKKIHDLFASDRLKYQDQYNEEGKTIQDLIQLWEKRLCSRMEGGKNGTYSSNLAEKFRGEIRKDYPLIDLIGVRLSVAN